MQTTDQALQAAGFKWITTPDMPFVGYWSKTIKGLEIIVEPLMFGQCRLQVFKEDISLMELPFKPIQKENEL